MSELILHHYPMSPFAEKVRLMLGFKQLPWRSVTDPAGDAQARRGGVDRRLPQARRSCRSAPTSTATPR